MTTPGLRLSAAPRWVPCAESPWLESQFPDLEGDEAKEGTAAHEMGECLLKGEISEASELIDRVASNGVVFVPEMIEPVTMYVEHVLSHGVGYWVEETVQLESNLLNKPITGHCDGAAFGHDQANRTLYIDDFKYGHGPVEVFENYQLLGYAFGIISKYQLNVDYITMSIVQPRAYHHNGPIRKWTVDVDDLWKYAEKIIDAGIAVQAADRLASTGDHCRHCKGLAYCPAAIAAGMNAVDVAYAPLPDTLTPSEVSALLHTLERAHNAIKHLLDASKSRAEAMILSGQPIPGRSLQPGKGKRKWISEDVAKSLGIPTKEALVTPAEAERQGVSKDIVASITTTPSTAPKLVKCDVGAKADEVFK